MRLIFRQVCVPDYRRGLFEVLWQKCSDLCVVTGLEYFAPSIRSIPDSLSWLVRKKTWFLLRRRFAWLQGISDILKPGDVLVHELNPRILSQWRDMLVCRRRGVKFVLWGHAWGRAGVNSWEYGMRKFNNRRADGIICYTETQAELMRTALPGIPVIAAPNACLYRDDCRVTGDESKRDAVIYVGRIVIEKKVRLLIEGFTLACQRDTGFKGRLIIVGDGPIRRVLEKRTIELGIVNRVEWRGHQSDIPALRGAYEKSFVSVSPGYVGLSLTQGFGFGVPALIAREEPHSPEIEAAKEGVNAHFFCSDNADDLATKLLCAWIEWRGIEEFRQRLSAWTAETYSFEKMAERFVEMANLVSMETQTRRRLHD